MANKIILKKTSTASKVPLSTDLEVGELAVNLADQKLYSKDAGGTVILVGSGTAVGDVVGGSSSTDNALARYDGTTGKLIQNSTVIVSDTGAITGAESISNIDFAQFDTTVTPVEAVAKMQWDDGNGTLQVGLKGGNVNLQLGQEVVARVYNDSGVALTDGQVVYISGSQGNRIAVKLAKADSEATSAGTLGVVTEPIAIGAEGFITMTGAVNKLNTTGLTAGALLYLSASTAGAYTQTPPTAPNHRVTIGYVERVDNIVGSIYVKVDNGYELDELHNVVITSPTSGQTLVYDAVQGVWENANISAGTGISVTNGAGSITVANTGVTSVNGVTGAVTATNLLDAIKTVDGAGSGLDADTLDGNSSAYFQQALVSGTNIKTVNSTSLLGSGNLAVGTVTSVTGGSYLTGGTITSTGTLAVDATSANTASKVVARDASGNFSAGTITANLTGTASAVANITRGDTGSADLNTITTSGFYRVNNANANRPADWGQLLVTYGGSDTIGQLYFDYTNGYIYSRAGNPSNVGGAGSWSDWRTTLNNANYNSYSPTLTGTGASGTWGISVTGNANTATTLATGRTIAITGDLTYTSPSFNGSGNVTATGTLATVNSNVGTYGSSTAIPVVTVNAKGLVTAVSTATVSGGQYFGTATTKAIAYNANSISENITVTAGNNGLSAGPITINTGYTVTVQTGANWVIV